jgi:hypothetical protein
MGLGTDPCGTNACGLDLQQPSGRANRRIPDALNFDGATRNFAIDSDGQYESAHPVDGKVFLICRTVLGSIRSAPELGQTISGNDYIEPRTAQTMVNDRFRVALQAVVNAGEIRILKIEVDTSVHGRLVTALHYVNLVTQRAEVVRNP